MPISISILAAATLAIANPIAGSHANPYSPIGYGSANAGAQPAWLAIHSDTIGDLLFTTEALNGRVRFVARGLKSSVPMTTADFTVDSVRTWIASATDLAASATPKIGEMHGLGQALTVNATTTATGDSVFGFYVGDAVTDQQLALALTKPNLMKLLSGLNSALDALSH